MKVKINRNPFFDGLEIFLYEERGDGQLAFGLPTTLEFKLYSQDDLYSAEEIQPTFKLTGRWGKAFLDAFAEALDQEGIKTDKDAKIEGTLNATKYHLEDLREMLKLKPKKED